MIKNFLNEFKKFAVRGNVIDMAIGIIIGAAFGKIVDSLVKDVMMPPIGWALGKVDFSNLKLELTDGVTINYGLFINSVISFLIVAFAVFVLIKAINKLQASVIKQEEAAAPATKTCPYCCSEIALCATKCPHCTADLPQVKEPKAKPEKKSAAKKTKKAEK